MGFRINTNINAIDTQRNLYTTSMNAATTFRRLSSGLRINSASDDAAGLAIGQKLNAQVNGLNQAVRNAQDGISLVQTAEGALQQTQSILQRMRQLAVQSANDTNTQTDRISIQSEMNQLSTELSRISNTTSFNTKNLLAGGFAGQNLQIGANLSESMSFSIKAMDASSLGVAANGATVSTTQNTANIQTIANVGSGFQNGAQYSVKSTSLNAGALYDANGNSTKGVVQGQNLGNEQLNVLGTWAGTSTTATNYTFRVSALDSTMAKVAQVQYSTDGGSTWATSNGAIQSDGNYAFNVNQSSAVSTSADSGLTFDFTQPASGSVNPAVGDQFTFSAVAGTGVQAATTVLGAGTGTGVVTGFGSPTVTGTFTGTQSGALSLAVTVSGANVVTAASVKVGTNTYVLGAPGTAGVTGTFSSAAGKLAINFMGLNIFSAGLTSSGAGTGTVTFATPNLTVTTQSTSGNIATSTAANIANSVSYVTAAASGAASTAKTLTMASISGQYIGGAGTINLVNTMAATTWNTKANIQFTMVDNLGNATTIAAPSITNYAYNLDNQTLTFTYKGATFNLANVPLAAGVAVNDEINIGLTSGASGLVTATSTTNAGTAVATSVSPVTGNQQLNIGGAFAGTATTNYLYKVTSVSNNQVTAAQFSTDGGTTWASSTASITSSGSYQFKVMQASTSGTSGDSGLLISFNNPLNTVAPQVGDQYSFQAVAATNATTAQTTVYNAIQFVNGTTAAVAPAATWTGTYNGGYSGPISVMAFLTAGAAGAANTWSLTGQQVGMNTNNVIVKIGNTTLDTSQVQLNTTANTISFYGLTFALMAGTQGTAGTHTSGYVNFATGQVTAASVGQSANQTGNALTTVGHLSATTNGGFLSTAAPVTTATVTSVGAGVTGLGAGTLLLHVKNFNAGNGSGTSSYGINNIAWLGAGMTKVGTTATGAQSSDFTYYMAGGYDVYTSGMAYGGSIAVTGADGVAYKVVVSNSTTAGAMVAIQNNAQTTTYATYNVALGNVMATSVDDVVAINLDQSNITSTSTKNVGAETAAISGTYTGTSNTMYTAKVSQIDTNGNATQILLSTNGGTTYGTTTYTAAGYSGTALAPQTATSFNLNNGLTLTLTPGQSNQNKAAVGDNFGFTALASQANGGSGSQLLQLQTTTSGTTYNLGGAQLLQANQTSAQVGAANLSLSAQFGALGTSGGITSGATTITAAASQAAVIGVDGTVVTNASAYAGLDVTSQTNAAAAISTIDSAINTVSLARAQLGAIQNRLNNTIANLQVGAENLGAAQSRIMDVDIAAETVNMTKNNILQQAGISVLAQTNQQPQMVLKLLQ